MHSYSLILVKAHMAVILYENIIVHMYSLKICIAIVNNFDNDIYVNLAVKQLKLYHSQKFAILVNCVLHFYKVIIFQRACFQQLPKYFF